MDDYLESLPQQLAAMQSAAAAEDWASLRITSHICKSNARDLGATTLSELCAALELQCKAGEPAAVADQLSAIEAASSKAMNALRAQDLADV